MSSFRNAAKSHQSVHRERGQPLSREHLGQLEKHRDYRRRADHVRDNKKTLRLLAKKALDKNPDEFYYHMVNSKLRNGVHHDIRDLKDKHTPDQIKLMDSQDVRYVNMKRTVETNKIRKLQSQLHMIDAADATPNQHIFFVDDPKEMKHFDLAKRLDTHPDLLKRKSNRLRLSDLEKVKLPDVDGESARALLEMRNKSYKELAKRIEREKELTVIQNKMEIKRHLKDKKSQRPKLIRTASVNSAVVYRWKYERKR